MDELGLKETIDNLIAKGRHISWVTKVADPPGKYDPYLPAGKPWYKSACPCYEGFYLSEGAGSVCCNSAGELLPGIVWTKVCSKDYARCPFYKEE